MKGAARHWRTGTYSSDSGDGGLVHEVHEVGAGQARRRAPDLVKVQVRLNLLAARVNVQDAYPTLRVCQTHT